MRAMQAEAFGGYGDLKLTDIPKPVVSDGRVLVHMTGRGRDAARPYDPERAFSGGKTAVGARQ